MMKKCINILILANVMLTFFAVKAQNDAGQSDDLGRIAIVAYVADQVENLPLAAKNNLQSKLSQIVTANGLGDSPGYDPRFIITPNISVLDKYVVAAAPPKVALTLEVAIFVGDGFTGKKFGQTAITVKGVGKTETKAYISAFKNMKTNNKEVRALLTSAKKRILEYYNTQCEFLLKNAEALAAQNRYDEAIYSLLSIPEVSKDCYNQALDIAKPLYRQKMDYDCKVLLTKARSAWNAGLDYEAANNAAFYLNQIEPNSACYNEVKSFAKEIGKRMEKVDDREWKFILKQEDNRTNIAVNSLKSMKEIALMYAKNQPQHVNYNVRGWW